jgi:hypothetical protein
MASAPAAALNVEMVTAVSGAATVGSRLALSRPRLRRLTALSRRSLRPPLATMISTLKAERPGSRGLSEQQREGDH